jgi:hypothetical protein
MTLTGMSRKGSLPPLTSLDRETESRLSVVEARVKGEVKEEAKEASAATTAREAMAAAGTEMEAAGKEMVIC